MSVLMGNQYWPTQVTFEKPNDRCNRITAQFEEFISAVTRSALEADNARLESDILRAIELQGWQRFDRLILVEDSEGKMHVASLLTNLSF